MLLFASDLRPVAVLSQTLPGASGRITRKLEVIASSGRRVWIADDSGVMRKEARLR